jgi:hypothetical protein
MLSDIPHMIACTAAEIAMHEYRKEKKFKQIIG